VEGESKMIKAAADLVEVLEGLEENDELYDDIIDALTDSNLADFDKGYITARIEDWSESVEASEWLIDLIHMLKTYRWGEK
jgi:hypothetical protein